MTSFRTDARDSLQKLDGAPAPQEATEVKPPETPGTSRFSQRWHGRLGLLPAGVFILIAIIGPSVIPWSATKVVGATDIPPNAAHYFGTDSSGLDIFSRVVAATRNDLMIAIATAIMATLAGIAIGLIVGMNESKRGPLGFLARGMSRALDLVQAVPAIVIGLVLALALAVILAPNQGRLVRTEVLRVRSEAYLDAARMSGEGELAVAVRHVLPNASWPALENASVVFSAAILLTATLGFLGVGLHPPTPEWGSMISTAASDAAVGRWWPGLFPAAAIVACVFAFAGAGQRLFGRK